MPDYETTPPPTRLADRVQLRTAFTTERGEVIRFVTQLEYWLAGEGVPIVRYDHDDVAPGGHDVTGEGLHRDVFWEGEKARSESIRPPIPADEAFTYPEDDLSANAEEYVREIRRMAHHQERDQPVSEQEFAEFPEKIHAHFDRIRERLPDN